MLKEPSQVSSKLVNFKTDIETKARLSISISTIT